MPKLIAIGGEPATGKTTLMLKVIERLGPADGRFECGLLRGTFYQGGQVLVLGVYDGGTFQGTDRLAMSVMPHAMAFLRTLKGGKHPNTHILFEGDRLMTEKFLESAAKVRERHVLFLTAGEDTKHARHAQRGDKQTATWLQGRATKYSNLMGKLKVRQLENNNLADQLCVLGVVLSLLGLEGCNHVGAEG